jgi:hypothetical protein
VLDAVGSWLERRVSILFFHSRIFKSKKIGLIFLQITVDSVDGKCFLEGTHGNWDYNLDIIWWFILDQVISIIILEIIYGMGINCLDRIENKT